MASLRDIKTQIGSVKATQQITSAMQTVASVKLKQAERIVNKFLPYQEKISELLSNFLRSETKFKSIFERKGEVKRVAIVAFSANMSLCGAFNSNVTKKLLKTIDEYSHLGNDNILIYTIGKKTDHAIRKMEVTPVEYHEEIAHKPDYAKAMKIANKLMEQFEAGSIDEVVMIYHKYKSKGVQVLVKETLLPVAFDEASKDNNNIEQYNATDYIIEPGREELLNELVPKAIKLKLYSALIESYSSEQAARNLAMQTATDNADDLLDDLSLLYNKSRQQSITNELLDIIGATFK